MGYYAISGHYSACLQVGNTFQLVLATDGSKSYALFLYGDMQWSTISAAVGFNAGRDERDFALNASLYNLLGNSTKYVEVPGRHIFRVDLDSIHLHTKRT